MELLCTGFKTMEIICDLIDFMSDDVLKEILLSECLFKENYYNLKFIFEKKKNI